MKDDVIAAATKSAPPVAVTGVHYLLSMPIEKWVAVVTIVYVLLQIFVLVRDKVMRK